MYTPDTGDNIPKVWTVEHRKDEGGDNETIRRYYKDPENLVSNEWSLGGNSTLYHTLEKVVEKWPQREVFGRRTLLNIEHVEKKIPIPASQAQPITQNAAESTEAKPRKSIADKVKARLSSEAPKNFKTKIWSYNVLSEYKWFTFSQFWEETNLIGRGLVSDSVGLMPHDTLEIYAPTSYDWIKMNIGCVRQSIKVATAYETLGAKGLKFSVNEAQAKALYTRVDMVHIAAAVAAESELVTSLIYFGAGEYDQFEESVKTKFEKATKLMTDAGKKMFSIEQIIEFGKADREANPDKENNGDHPPTPEDIALIMYTSGTTGDPKGVVIKHKNISALVGSINLHLLGTFRDDDVIIAYLPLAHILEYAVEFLAISLGIRVGYGTPRTLTTSMVHGCLGDLEALRPTLMAGVPQVWNGIARELTNQIKSRGYLVSSMFNAALKLKWSRMQKDSTTKNWTHENILFSKPRQLVGGRLRLALSGGAAISSETQQMLSCVLCPIIQGYGMTESCGVIAIQKFETFGLKKTGPTLPSLEVKLFSVPEAGYQSENNQGEVWVRGPSVSSGYLSNPPDVEKTFTSDGWLRTGDIGEWSDDGQLKIIDRLKNLVKLLNGEYIALEQLESAYIASPYTQNICIQAQSDQSQPIAIVSMDDKIASRLAQEAGLDPHTEKHDLCDNVEAQKVIIKTFNEIAKKNNFIKSQMVQGVIIDEHEWTAENGVLTAAGKLQRRVVEEKNKEKIKKLYSSLAA
ncbi:hypothetical protein BB558_003423 [Smittium angustum]|uniref:AMP-dependent synthetase/ligase domain-containing protein n=1 Tax=Smittium angustum TaxID=133377 RepID=A0A2U1J5Z4_SMIAN|nr:hypothetical protein BB558_003423 [Smittium angustum]